MEDGDIWPKDEVWGENPKLFCLTCWQVEKRKVCEEIEDPDKRRDALVRADLITTNNPNKRRRLTSCKWCGSATHKTKRSRECPHNKKNLKQKKIEEDKGESDHDDDEDDEEFDLFVDHSDSPPAVTSPAPPAVPPSAPPAVPPPAPPAPPTHSFKSGDNALLKTSKNETRLVQIFKIDGTKSHCYLVNSDDVKIVDTTVLRPERFPTPKRHEFLNMEFFLPVHLIWQAVAGRFVTSSTMNSFALV